MFRRLSIFVLNIPLIAVLWRKLTRNLGAGYRPERHYMRGPGPKSHEHNSRSPV
jgi:hypothetical protein